MRHFLQLLVIPIEFLLGLSCGMTAIVLYPNEEGKMQSKFEDFWIRVDDYQRLALSRHAAFMTQVAKLESNFLDRVFGSNLVSARSIAVSCWCSVVSLVLTIILMGNGTDLVEGEPLPFVVGLLIVIALLIPYILLPHHHRARDASLFSAVAIILGEVIWLTLGNGIAFFEVFGLMFLTFFVGGFCCDAIFIVLTRRLLRWAGEMTASLKVVGVLILNLALAIALVSPVFFSFLLPSADFLHGTWFFATPTLMAVAMSNLFNSLLALLFVVLATILLIHRALWPLLTRTLFRMQDLGTTGRRAILMTVGLSLMSLSGWKVPELFKALGKIIGK
jgi:hypothetical protein